MTRKEALKAITEFVENYACGSDLDGLRDAIEALKEQRPHGKWEWKSPTPKTIMTPHCNNCGHMNEFLIETNFCPNCGADMRKEGKRND